MLVVGNCQAEATRLLLASSGAVRSFRVPPVHEWTAEDLARAQELLRRTDVLVTQPVRDDYRGLACGTGQLAQWLPATGRTVVYPVLRFDGLMPYQAIVRSPSDPSLNPPLVPYHDLRVLAAAERIAADDGSTIPPEVDSPLPVRVVRQEDRGFRAAAARNLGAAHARHPVLVFLDGDTVPGPGYLSAATRWVAAQERAVVVGERRQDGVEPAWLRDAWADTEDLERADETSWRFVLSCVLTCSTQFFRAIGGFDDSMVGYGGEDWEFGWRAWNAGAVFIHEPQAVADHREDDWAARRVADDGVSVAGVAEKNAESQALARRITHPIARSQGVLFDTADVVVTFAGCARAGDRFLGRRRRHAGAGRRNTRAIRRGSAGGPACAGAGAG